MKENGFKVLTSVDGHGVKHNVYIGTIGHVDASKTTLEEAINKYLEKAAEADKIQSEKTYSRKRKRVK